jgi:hypothetical protein
MSIIRRLAQTATALAFVSLVATPAAAQVVQSLHVGVGAFLPRDIGSRAPGDVLVENLSTFEPLAFNITDFRGGQIFGEWNVSFGQHVELGAGLSYYRRTVPSVYRNVINSNGSEIAQNLSLRVVPVTGLIRFMPFGRFTSVQPYIGTGISALNYRYSEIGDFVDTSDYSVFNNNTTPFIATGTAVGPVVVGGLRVPVGGDIYGLTVEWRYQFATGKTGGLDAGFLSDKIDLGGGTFNFGFLVRF